MKYKFLPYLLLTAILAVYTYFTVITFLPIKGYIADEVWYPSAAYNYLKLIFHITPHMYVGYPNENGIANYVNPDHPPLGKYFMDLFILALGYRPLAWRLPSWIFGDALLVVGYFFGKKLYEKVTGNDAYSWVIGLLSTVLIAVDPNIWVMHGIAMLEIYVGFFGMLSLYFLISGNYTVSAITLGLAFASKESAYMLIFPFLWFIGDIYKTLVMRVYYGILLPLATYLALSLPIMWYYGGFFSWFQHVVLHEATWDAENGHITLSATSQISTPWGWFLNIHPFYLGYSFFANTDPVVLILAVVLTVFFILFKEKTLLFTFSWAWIEWFGFVMVYVLGNHTLFSFYVTDFSPVIDASLAPGVFRVAQILYQRYVKTRNAIPPSTPEPDKTSTQ
ncbi:glycosyl transferase [Sulfolobales archaeon HS-7]|nr:glycosyl transferase [Sulfolobales archaeon HS-7]